MQMSGYFNLRGHQVWNYEWSDNGDPLVLLHGGMSATEDFDKYLLPAVENSHHVFAYDRTGQGRTGDQEGSFHFDFQTKEAIAYLEDVVRGPAHLVGWSDGGIISLLVALARPDLVKSIVAIGTNYHFDNGSQHISPWPLSEKDRIEHAERSPDPDEALDEKQSKMIHVWNTEPSLTTNDLARILCPVLVLSGDDEAFSFEHTTSLYEALPQGQLAIIPGASHFVIKEKPVLVQTIIRGFLADLTPPQTRIPIRRR
jgi:pimeloyl-ACP methyl ester carboxylesterase